MKLSFVSSSSPAAVAACHELTRKYGHCDASKADMIVALGGDGLMLQTLHKFMNSGVPIFGMNRGSIGFLMNEYSHNDLLKRIDKAHRTTLHPLKMTAYDSSHKKHSARAINEVSLLRQTHQAARLRILIDNRERLSELICDGILVATPAGSTAYNLSAQGPILPISAPLLAMTPISAFRPRHWRGALLPNKVTVAIDVLEAEKRPISAVADHFEIRKVCRVEIVEDRSAYCDILFDADHGWDERILSEMFRH